MAGHCRYCKDWTQDTSKSTELFLAEYHGNDISRIGRCMSNASGLVKASYDGGYSGEMLTDAKFSCNKFKAEYGGY